MSKCIILAESPATACLIRLQNNMNRLLMLCPVQCYLNKPIKNKNDCFQSQYGREKMKLIHLPRSSGCFVENGHNDSYFY